ncbi:hypothetical protein C5167_011592 [Papaver somniferum]|uniref:Uncharacterized protein n=1 Tax=Papaver somniferum TaxID=3469 RepID=A0A4Y7K7C5_PAPSO|nr:hypothetical protein C5167_011592 [Papaver somniferum]
MANMAMKSASFFALIVFAVFVFSGITTPVLAITSARLGREHWEELVIVVRVNVPTKNAVHQDYVKSVANLGKEVVKQRLRSAINTARPKRMLGMGLVTLVVFSVPSVTATSKVVDR